MTHSINGMAERFREALNAPGVIELPGCYDVISAMLLERAGFATVFLSGYGVAASLLGNPDIGLTSLVETAQAAKNVANAIHVPVVVDADNGYGNEDNVIRTIYELEHAGAAAITMEDQVFPKRCGHAANKSVVPLAHYMQKLECALKARQTPLCIIARTDAENLDEAILRATTFHAAGADATIVDGLKSMDALKRVADEIPGHKQVNLIFGGKTPILSVADLHRIGFKIVLYSTPALYVATQAVFTQMRTLQETHDLNSISEQSINFRDFQQFIEKSYSKRRGMIHIDESTDGSGAVAAQPAAHGRPLP
jgi:2-methylisocitrate lyase-like PEP mutase family enzyme